MAAKTKTTSVPAPVKGWNARDPLAQMDPLCAVVMENWFPDVADVKLRNGFAEHVTGLPSGARSLMTYNGLSSNTLFAVASGDIYDVSTAGVVGTAVNTGFTEDSFQYVNFGTPGGQFLWACNGADTPITYNGSAWGTASLTGPTHDPIWVNAHQRRLFFGEPDSLKFWYLPVNAISGTAASFDLASLCVRGGYLQGMCTWTRDGGSGMDDVAVFVTSEGEAVVYSGVDPSTAADWQMIGVFRIGKPIGRRFYQKFGPDTVIITEDGFLSLSAALPVDRVANERIAISDQINGAVNDAVKAYGGLDGWECFLHPRGKWLAFNIPTSASTAEQFVFNTITRAPCKFTGMNALTWGMFENAPYFSTSDGTIYKADTGANDNNTNVDGDLLPAFNYFGSKGKQKLFKMVRPIMTANSAFSPALNMNVNFSIADPTSTPSFSVPSQSTWNNFNWNQGTWASSTETQQNWLSVSGLGYSAALRIVTGTKDIEISLRSIDYVYEEGGVL